VGKRTVQAVIVSVAIVLAAGACGSDHGDMAMEPGAGGGSMPAMGDMGDTGDHGQGTVAAVPDGADFNAADVAFAQQMIVHHGQAITMSELVLEVSEDAEVRALAEQIKAAQDPEIATMTGWLEEWGYDAPDAMAGDHGGAMGSSGSMPMPGMPMSGMMTDDEMGELEGATGADFDRMFLTMMIRHHEGAIEMAEALLAEGEHPGAQELARAIITAQRAEIETMEAMVAARPS
jgi:uncharacterized protein (DUF305 family)